MTSSHPTLTGLLEKIEERLSGDDDKQADGKLSLGDILEVVGRRAYGPLLLIIGILSVSPLALIPGSTWAFAALTLLVAAQMAFNRKKPWLPKAALKTSFPEDKVSGALKRVRPWTQAIDKLVKPRLEFLAGEPWLALVALLAIVAALLTFPLSFIPLAPLIPGSTIVLIGLGVTARDGLVLAVAMLVVLAGGWWLGQKFL